MVRNGSDPSSRPSESPLKLFVQAKKHINDTFQAIHTYIEESRFFIDSQDKILTSHNIAEVGELVNSVASIRDVLSRDIMKVAFFGRTSNGKSTVINAVLGSKILPCGMGHTTNCFLQVEGTDEPEAYLISEEKPFLRQNVESISHLANALTSNTLGDSSLVRIHWPKSKCSLLRDDAVFVDTPGVDVTQDIDSWIDKYCLDADVFILVSNAESTLMQTEKAFFHKVSQRLSKPNIFILNNRWEAIASEPENADAVRKQHTDREVDFLCKELNVVSPDEAKNRVFFVSAKEALQYRLGQDTSRMAEGFQDRYHEFQDFELKFEECLSRSAVRTKFDQHSKKGKKIVIQVRNILESAYAHAEELVAEKQGNRRELHSKLIFTQQQMHAITSEIKDHIKSLVQQVESKVCMALAEEIKRLSVLINDYEKPFNADPLFLVVYKKDLHTHVERGLGLNLRARLSTALTGTVETAQRDMADRIRVVVGDSTKKPLPFDAKPRSTFEVFYRLNCESLCSDFQEDLEFKFSLGLVSLLKRFSHKNPFRKEKIARPLGPTPTSDLSPVNDVNRLNDSFTDSEGVMLMLMIEKLTMIAPQSQTTIGTLALGGFLVRTVGWKLIAITCGIYALLYAYERMTWNNRAKEREFKRQYVQHATRKLKLIVDLTSANCSHQVQQELTSTFARMCTFVDEVVKDMSGELNRLDQEISELSESASLALDLRNRAEPLLIAMDEFKEKYLSHGDK